MPESIADLGAIKAYIHLASAQIVTEMQIAVGNLKFLIR